MGGSDDQRPQSADECDIAESMAPLRHLKPTMFAAPSALWRPPRHRTLPRSMNLRAGGAATCSCVWQRKESSLLLRLPPPLLLPSPIFSLRGHVCFARAMIPQRTLLRSATPQCAWNIDSAIARNPAAIRERRADALAELRTLAARLQFQTDARSAQLVEGHPRCR